MITNQNSAVLPGGAPNRIGANINADDFALLNKRELAARLRLSTRSVDEWMRAKRLPYLKIGKTVRFDWQAVRAHLNNYQIGA